MAATSPSTRLSLAEAAAEVEAAVTVAEVEVMEEAAAVLATTAARVVAVMEEAVAMAEAVVKAVAAGMAAVAVTETGGIRGPNLTLMFTDLVCGVGLFLCFRLLWLVRDVFLTSWLLLKAGIVC